MPLATSVSSAGSSSPRQSLVKWSARSRGVVWLGTRSGSAITPGTWSLPRRCVPVQPCRWSTPRTRSTPRRSISMFVAVLSETTIIRLATSRREKAEPGLSAFSTPEPVTCSSARSTSRSSRSRSPAATASSRACRTNTLIVLAAGKRSLARRFTGARSADTSLSSRSATTPSRAASERSAPNRGSPCPARRASRASSSASSAGAPASSAGLRRAGTIGASSTGERYRRGGDAERRVRGEGGPPPATGRGCPGRCRALL